MTDSQTTPTPETLLWLLRLSHDMMGTREIGPLFTLITRAVARRLGAQRGFVMLCSDDGTLIPASGRAWHPSQQQPLGSTTDGTTKLRANSRDSQQRAIQRNQASASSHNATATAAATATDVGSPLPPTDAIMHLAQQAMDDQAVGTSEEGRSPAQTQYCIPLITRDRHTTGVLFMDQAAQPLHMPTLQLLGEQMALAIDNARMFQRASQDALTGLPNAGYFTQQLEGVLRTASPKHPGGVLLLDLDTFRRINEAGGSEAGDTALMDIAHTLQDVLRSDGLVARYSSDKFAVLIPPEPDARMAVRLRDAAERAAAAIRTKRFHHIAISACVGGLLCHQGSHGDAHAVIAQVDLLLNVARRRGPGELEISHELATAAHPSAQA